MRKLVLPTAAVTALLIATIVWADTPGTFRGVIVHGPDIVPGWMFLKSANGQVRKVGISRAQVVYSDGVPAKERQKEASASIATGAEVRVTATQDENGEWRASKIEILSLHHGDTPTVEPSERSDDLRST